jgi:hypothetical protein
LSERLPEGATLSADKNYHAESFVEGLKAQPHVAINGTISKFGKVRKTAVPSKVAASLRYAISQRLRKRIEECFGWGNTVGGLAQLKVRGPDGVHAAFVLGFAAYNLVRLPKLLASMGEVCPTAQKGSEKIQRRGPFLTMNPSEAKNLVLAYPLAHTQ